MLTLILLYKAIKALKRNRNGIERFKVKMGKVNSWWNEKKVVSLHRFLASRVMGN